MRKPISERKGNWAPKPFETNGGGGAPVKNGRRKDRKESGTTRVVSLVFV